MSLEITQDPVVPVVTPEANTSETLANTKPAGIPDKFWDQKSGKVDYENLAKSYTELEKRLGGAEVKPEDAAAAAEQTQTEVPTGDFAKFQTEYAESGVLADASYKELADKGLSKEMVDTYINAVKNQADLGEAQVLSSVGGREVFNTMATWAQSGLDAKELDTFNAQVSSSVEAAAMAVQWLKSKYEAANGRVPKLLSGRTAPGAQLGFATRSDMMKAISDKRYGKDPEYTEQVARDVANKQFGALSS